MALSDREQELLDQLERQLNDDPAFASAMTSSESALPTVASPRALILGLLGLALGLGLILVGVSTKLIFLGLLGFLLALAGLYYASRSSGKSSAQAPQSTAAGPKAPSAFMRNLEDRWDQRQGGGAL